MNKIILDKEFWESQYQNNDTGWDTGDITTPLKEYINQLTNNNLAILVPGAGNGYEAGYLFDKGFTNVWIADIAPTPLLNFKKKHPSFPDNQLLNVNFFDISIQFDLILEQTFFCALDPSLRPAYAQKMYELLKPGGKLVGLLFNDMLYKNHPPFGGNKEEYEEYFKPYFNFKHFDTAYNSIKPRSGRELFICLEKKNID
jgi:SAM-dependent methyltransferase